MAESIETDIVSFLDKSNLIIKDMHLGNLFMAMMMVKIYKEKAVFSSAGMPPPLIFRQKSKEVEEIRLPALPLGGSADFKYKKTETILSQGDTLLLMSDGFPELFNEQKEILDYKKSKKIGRGAPCKPDVIFSKPRVLSPLRQCLARSQNAPKIRAPISCCFFPMN